MTYNTDSKLTGHESHHTQLGPGPKTNILDIAKAQAMRKARPRLIRAHTDHPNGTSKVSLRPAYSPVVIYICNHD